MQDEQQQPGRCPSCKAEDDVPFHPLARLTGSGKHLFYEGGKTMTKLFAKILSLTLALLMLAGCGKVPVIVPSTEPDTNPNTISTGKPVYYTQNGTLLTEYEWYSSQQVWEVPNPKGNLADFEICAFDWYDNENLIVVGKQSSVSSENQEKNEYSFYLFDLSTRQYNLLGTLFFEESIWEVKVHSDKQVSFKTHTRTWYIVHSNFEDCTAVEHPFGKPEPILPSFNLSEDLKYIYYCRNNAVVTYDLQTKEEGVLLQLKESDYSDFETLCCQNGGYVAALNPCPSESGEWYSVTLQAPDPDPNASGIAIVNAKTGDYQIIRFGDKDRAHQVFYDWYGENQLFGVASGYGGEWKMALRYDTSTKQLTFYQWPIETTSFEPYTFSIDSSGELVFQVFQSPSDYKLLLFDLVNGRETNLHIGEPKRFSSMQEYKPSPDRSRICLEARIKLTDSEGVFYKKLTTLLILEIN